jgi:hypothetical protein
MVMMDLNKLAKSIYHYRNFSLCQVFSLCREPNKKLSAKPLPRVFYLALGTEKTLGKQASLPRAKQKALGTEKTLTKDSFTKSQLADSRQRKFKKSLFCLYLFFYPQHTLI